jgi:hypothetical protein
MPRIPRRSLAIGACSALLLTACATKPSSELVHFYVSCVGEHQPTCAVAHAADARLRTEPGFLRDFTEPMNVHIVDGSLLADGQYRYPVQITLPTRVADRRIKARDRTLAAFDVTCVPDSPQPCVDAILDRARLQPSRIRRIVARSPKA